MYKIFNNDIKQLNIGDVQGTLYDTFNCDLTLNKGKLGIGARTIITTDTVSNMGVTVGFRNFDGRFFAVSGSRVFSNGGTTAVGGFAADASTDTPTSCSADYSDIEVFNDVLLVSSADKILSKAADGSGTGVWTSRRNCTGSAATPHPICVYNNRAYWLDALSPSRIYSMNTSYSVSTSGNYTMTLPAEYNVIWIEAYSNGIMIGTIHKYGGEGLVFDWDGVTENKWNRAYRVFAQGALACYIDNDIPYVINSNAELLQFTGGGFKVAGRLPINKDSLYKATELTKNDRFIHPNGITSINGYISLLINNRSNNPTDVTYQSNIHSGVWEFDGKSLYHKHSMSYRTNPALGGYIGDYGQVTLSRVGGLLGTPDSYSYSSATKANFLAGAEYYTDASSTGYGIWADSFYDDIEKCGWFSTVQIRAQHFEEMWNKITLLYNPTTDNKFVVKYRTTREDHVDFDITWTSQKTFTTTEATLAVGDEITIIQGDGSGRVAHITSITGTYDVTIDDSVGIVSGTARARKQNWKKIGEITSSSQKYDESIIGVNDTWIEIKVFMLGTGEYVLAEEMVLDNTKYK